MAIATDDGLAGQDVALFGSQYVDDPLFGRLDVVELDPELLHVFTQGFDLQARLGVLDFERSSDIGRDIVVNRGDVQFGAADVAVG